jgi:DNA modification methylase
MNLILGDCLDKLKELDDNSVDSIVTDPPYGLSFMGKKWDYDVPSQAIWEECMRVLKPGGHLLAFAGSRTYHRMAVRIEDAGFEIRDQIMWIYGSGFPKSMDISKQIDKKGGTIGKNIVALKQKLIELVDKSGKTRKNIDKECGFRATNYLTLPKKDKKPDPWVNILPTDDKWNKIKEVLGVGDEFDDIFVSAKREVIGIQTKARSENSSFTMPTMGDITEYKSWDITAPATDEAKEWEGWGTALKPAHEPIVMARKPLSGKTVVDNVLEWGTGGINIDDSRIGLDEELDKSQLRTINRSQKTEKDGWGMNSNGSDTAQVVRPEGRFPANIIFDEEAGKILDEQSGISKSTGGRNGNKEGIGHNGMYGKYNGEVKDGNPGLGDVGGASRFFYCPKTSKTDRNEGLDEFEEKTRSDMNKMMGKSGNFKTGSGNDRTTEFKNHHPTVKPTDLMLYLIRLVTPKGGTTLDPFMGSGSTGKAAVRGGFDFVGIEREKDYFQIAEARIQYEIDNPYIEGKDERIQLNKTAKNFW